MGIRTKSFIVKLGLYIILVFLLAEVAFRVVLCGYFNTRFFHPSAIIYRYYPEIQTLIESPVKRSRDTITILILGGSTVSDLFCNTSDKVGAIIADSVNGRRVRLYNMARVAQNSLDARIKLQLLHESRFNYIVFYEAINDIRADNCPADVFDSLYRHIEFYQNVNIILRHREINISVIPFVIDLCFHKILILSGIRKTIPKEFYQLDETGNRLKPLYKKDDALFFASGNDVKTAATYENNLERIYESAGSGGAKLILLSYAHYLPPDYTLDGLMKKRLRSAGKYMFPVEMWGDPQHVASALNIHNAILKRTAQRHKDILWCDFDGQMAKGDETFLDICHLTDQGCAKLAAVIASTVITDTRQYHP